MKNTIRILSLVLALAMMVGVFAAAASAEEATETILFEEKFDDQPAAGTGHWSSDYHPNAFTWIPGTPANTENQHVKLTHNNPAEGMRVYIGAALDPEDGITYEYGKIAAKDLTFDAKIEEGTAMRIEFYVVWNLTKSDSTTETVTRRIEINVDGEGKITAGSNATVLGTIPATVDTSEWNTWTLRVSRASKYSGDYDVQLMVNGVNYITESQIMTTQGSPARERFAIHARSVGTIEIDNLKVDELYLDGKMGAVSGTPETLFSSGFGALGTELTYDDVDGSYTPGQWKRGAHENTSITMVEDDATADEGGYLKTSYGSSDRYANGVMTGLVPVDATVYLKFDLKLDGESLEFLVGGAKNDNGRISGRQMAADFRPDGLYFTTPDGAQKADFELPTVTEWNTYIIKIDYAAQKATVYANGTELGDIRLNNLGYSETATNFTELKMRNKGANNLSGSAYVDNIKLSYGVDPTQTQTPGEPPVEEEGPSNTADASIIGLAAMMLPVSGFGISALALKRKKEN